MRLDGPLVETLPDGRHRTNLDMLIRTPEAGQHFREITELVSRCRIAHIAQVHLESCRRCKTLADALGHVPGLVVPRLYRTGRRVRKFARAT